MRVVMLVICFINSMFYKNYIMKIIEVENEVYGLYTNNFENYLMSDENYNLLVDEKKMKNYFESKQIKIQFINNTSFKVKVKNWEKVYNFYMVKNDGDK